MGGALLHTNIFYSVNAALYFHSGGNGLLVDGVHQKGLFSAMPAALRQNMENETGLFAHVNSLVFTHLHEDHYDAETASALAARLDIPLWGPGLAENGAAPTHAAATVTRLEVPGFTVLAASTPHDGAAYCDEAHHSFFVACGGECFFVAGDARLAPENAVAFLRLAPKVDAAFVNIYQVSGNDGRAFLRALQPKRTFLYHLPLPADDTYGYHRFVTEAARRFPAELGTLEFPTHMAWIDNSRPNWAAADG